MAVITGALTAVFLLVTLLVVALRLQCRRQQLRAAASAAAVVMSASSGALSSGHRGSVAGGTSGAGSETLLLVKSEQLRSSTPLFNNVADPDDRNPDLIPHRDGNWPDEMMGTTWGGCIAPRDFLLRADAGVDAIKIPTLGLAVDCSLELMTCNQKLSS